MELFFIALITLIATGVGTVTGFGSSTIMLPLLLLFYSLPESLLLAGIVHIFNDVWKVGLFKNGLRWRLILEFGIPGVIFSFLGARLIFSIPESIGNMALGIFFIAYVVFLIFHPKFKIKHKGWTASVGGALSGFSAGIFGLGGAIRSAFLSAFDLPKEVYIATIGAIALFTDIIRVLTYYEGGARLSSILTYGLILIIPISFIGAKLGKNVLHKIPQNRFRMVIAGFLLLVGLKLIIF